MRLIRSPPLLRTYNIAKIDAKSDLNSIAFSPDRTLFATATQGGGIHLWSSANGSKLGVLQGQPSQPLGLAFSPDGTYLYSVGEKGEVAAWGPD